MCELLKVNFLCTTFNFHTKKRDLCHINGKGLAEQFLVNKAEVLILVINNMY